MRVCMLNNNFYRSSGITHVIRRIADAVPRSQVEFFFAGCGHSGIRGLASCTEDFTWIPADRYQQFDLATLSGRLLPELYQFVKWLRHIKCDIIHVHHRRLAVLAQMLSKFTDIPVLFTGHLPMPKAGWFKKLSPVNATGVSPSVLSNLRHCTRAKQLDLIWNPVTFPTTFRASLPGSYRKAITVGRLDPVKGHEHLINAWSLLKERGVDAQLDIFGEGVRRPCLEALAHDKGLDDRISFCGYSSDLDHAWPQYSFNILVSEIEGLGNTIIEAAANGRPSLVTDVDGSRDTVPKQVVLPNRLPYGDIEKLADALQIWFSNPSQVAADGAEFYAYLRNTCDTATVCNQYIAVYQRMLAAGKGCLYTRSLGSQVRSRHEQ
jgi:glycosyltransferase involved in cell wall biosynthesis